MPLVWEEPEVAFRLDLRERMEPVGDHLLVYHMYKNQCGEDPLSYHYNTDHTEENPDETCWDIREWGGSPEALQRLVTTGEVIFEPHEHYENGYMPRWVKPSDPTWVPE